MPNVVYETQYDLKKDGLKIDFLKPSIPLKYMVLFCQQFGAMLQAGISVARALEVCGIESTHKALQKHLFNVYRYVVKGYSLSEAMYLEKVFPSMMVQMVACGEVSGNLEEVIRQLSSFFAHQLEMQRKIKKALTYPFIVLGVMSIAFVILMVEVVPSLMSLLVETGTQMPSATKIFVKISGCLTQHGVIVGVIFLMLVSLGTIFRKTKQGKVIFDYIKIYIPIIKKLYKKQLTATFSSTLSMLVSSGIPMLQAMDIVKNVIGHTIAERELEKAMLQLRKGASLSAALKGSVIYPPILYSMIQIGEESGTLDEMLIKMSHYLSKEVELVVEELITLIEPFLTIVMAILIGGMMLAIIQPTFSAATTIF